jgi:hypothetical protein
VLTSGWVGRLGGAVVCVLLILVVASLVYGPASRSALPTRDSVAGTCHHASDATDLIATASDTSPAVPCTQPHQTETLWTVQITGLLAGQKERPNPELINATLAGRCDDYWRVRAYLGADTYDDHWGVSTVMKVPTPAEWAKGDRTLRCEAVSGKGGSQPPTASDTLRGILRRKDSAPFRLCRVGGQLVSCDQGHDEEAMSPNVVLKAAPWPGSTPLAVAAHTSCAAIAQHYLGVRLTSRPDLAVAADLPTQADWAAGNRGVNCWLQNSNGFLTTGTVRGDLS